MNAERGRSAAEVGLAHEVVVKPAGVEARGGPQQLGLAVDGENDDPDRYSGRGCGEGLAGGVRELGSGLAKGEIVSDYQVVVGAALVVSPVILGGGFAVKLAGS